MVWMSAVRRAQEAFLVGIEDGNQRDLGQVEAFPEQVNADDHIVDTQPQITQDFDPLDGVNLGMQVVDFDPQLADIFRKVFSHALGQGRDERAFTPARCGC